MFRSKCPTIGPNEHELRKKWHGCQWRCSRRRRGWRPGFISIVMFDVDLLQLSMRWLHITYSRIFLQITKFFNSLKQSVYCPRGEVTTIEEQWWYHVAHQRDLGGGIVQDCWMEKYKPAWISSRTQEGDGQPRGCAFITKPIKEKRYEIQQQ